jgi:hypothetical protein
MGGKDGVGRNCAHASSKPGLISSKKEARLDGWTIMGLARTKTSRVRGNRTIPAVAAARCKRAAFRVFFFSFKEKCKKNKPIPSDPSCPFLKERRKKHVTSNDDDGVGWGGTTYRMTTTT